MVALKANVKEVSVVVSQKCKSLNSDCKSQGVRRGEEEEGIGDQFFA